MPASPNRLAFDTAIDHWNNGVLDRYLDLYDESIQLHGYGPEPLGKHAVAGMYGSMFESIADITIHVDDVFEVDDRLCCRARLTGRHVGPLFGVEATEREIEQGVITILRFADGRCVERWSVADTLAVLLQIGAVEMPG